MKRVRGENVFEIEGDVLAGIITLHDITNHVIRRIHAVMYRI